MGTIFRKTITRPLPSECKLITRKGRRLAQWVNRNGKTVTAELTEAGDRIRTESRTFVAKFRDGDGIIQEVSTGCRDKSAALAVLAELEQQAEKIKAKILTTDEVETARRYSEVPLSEHITAYSSYLIERGVTSDWIRTSKTYLSKSVAECKWRFLRDLSADALVKWLALQVTKGMSARVRNVYAQTWVAFGNWCVGKRQSGKSVRFNGERRLAKNPFQGLESYPSRRTPSGEQGRSQKMNSFA